MNIIFIGHAGFLVETKNTIIVMDPWLSKFGAFDGGWFQFPCNHHMNDFIRTKISTSKKDVYVYISHEHKDHFDVEFLKSINNLNFNYIIPRFRRTLLIDEIKKFSTQKIILCGDSQVININENEYLKIYIDDSELNRDSAILFSSNGRKFFNSNDCKLHDRFVQIKKEEGDIDVFAIQFSGATWHPTCYDYDLKEYERISLKKRFSKFEATASAIKTLKPEVYIPSAGPACFLDPSLIEINFEKNNIFPRNAHIIQYINKRLKNTKPQIADLAPGDYLDVNSSIKISFVAKERVNEENFSKYIKDYANRYKDFFEGRKKKIDKYQLHKLQMKLIDEFSRKLINFKSRDQINRPLFIQFLDYPKYQIKINFRENNVQTCSKELTGDYYIMKANSYDLERVLDGHLTWEDFALTFRMRLNRKPDVYQVLMQGFLILEVDDMNPFCDKILEVENRKERIVVEVGGCKYSVDRYCPHQGGDLLYAWEAENRYLVCARHRWYFDLEDGGKCNSNFATINAVPLDEI